MAHSDKNIQKFEQFSRAPRAISHLHAQVHDGHVFSFCAVNSLASDGTFDIAIKNPAGQFPHFRTLRLDPSAGPYGFEIYENVFTDVNSLGTVLTPVNFNRASSNVQSATLHVQPFTDANSLGAQIEDTLVHGTGPLGGNPLEAIEFEFILNQSTDYLVRLVNHNNGTTSFAYTGTIYVIS